MDKTALLPIAIIIPFMVCRCANHSSRTNFTWCWTTHLAHSESPVPRVGSFDSLSTNAMPSVHLSCLPHFFFFFCQANPLSAPSILLSLLTFSDPQLHLPSSFDTSAVPKRPNPTMTVTIWSEILTQRHRRLKAIESISKNGCTSAVMIWPFTSSLFIFPLRFSSYSPLYYFYEQFYSLFISFALVFSFVTCFFHTFT